MDKAKLSRDHFTIREYVDPSDHLYCQTFKIFRLNFTVELYILNKQKKPAAQHKSDDVSYMVSKILYMIQDLLRYQQERLRPTESCEIITKLDLGDCTITANLAHLPGSFNINATLQKREN